MSEYQSYEFATLDRPLTAKEIAELRAISTRADITPTHFSNDYQWGDLKADPADLLARYFDVHVYLANWGTRRVMFRLPADVVNQRALKAYFTGDAARLRKVGHFFVLDMHSETEEPEDVWPETSPIGILSGLRTSLLQGDMTPAYLAWLLGVQAGDFEDSMHEPPVPAGLAQISAPCAAFMEFLRIDADLVSVASEVARGGNISLDVVRRWVRELSPAAKEKWLLRAVEHPQIAIGAEMLQAQSREASPAPTPRKVGQLVAHADVHRQSREQQEAERRKAEEAKQQAARAKKLQQLARQGDHPWARLEKLVDERRYDEAVAVTVDLRDVALAGGHLADFDTKLAALRKQCSRRRGYLDAIRSKFVESHY